MRRERKSSFGAFPARLRGRLRVPPLRTASGAPFGLIACHVWHWPSDALVYPADGAADAGKAEGGFRRPEKTPSETRRRRIGYLQVHQDGMPLQHVAWKTYAKTGEMMSKRF